MIFYNNPSMATVQRPAEIAVLWEFNEARAFSYNRPNYSGALPGPVWGGHVSAGRYGVTHNGGGNLTYCDGHVKWLGENSETAGDFGLTPDDKDNGYTHSISW